MKKFYIQHQKLPIFQHNKNSTNRHFRRSQPLYSEEEEYYNQNQQQYKNNPQN